jgi:hypothetical protein
MPIRFNEEGGGKILVIHVSGTLAKPDYAQLVPEMERLVQQHGKVRVLIEMTDFHGWDVSAAWEDFKFGVEHFSDIERMAMVGENKWQHGMATFCKPFTTAKVRYFDHSDAALARQWLVETVATESKIGGRNVLKHQLLLPDGILILEPDVPLEASDFDSLDREIDPYIAEHGKLLGLMIHAKAFPGWANIEAFLAHMQFIKSHHQKIIQLAMVTDSKVLGEFSKISAHLVHVQIKHFSELQHEDALSWLKAETPVNA